MREEPRRPWWAWPLLIVFLPLVIVVLALWLLGALLLQVMVWAFWCSRGRYALVVYSNSPIWQEYFEERVLPALGARAVVLNWSERKQWDLSLATTLFTFFGGSREFNPIAIVFEPFRWPRYFRFYRAFREFKHGRREPSDRMVREFFTVLDEVAPIKAV
jgi:hypothetical protein